MRTLPGPLCVLACALGLLAALPDGLAFTGENPATPRRGARVPAMPEFYLEADGRPGKEEFYRIEVASDPEFERIVRVFDMRESRAGWMLGDPLGLEDVPEQYLPRNFEGIHYRATEALPDGTYWWRASKAIGGGAWEPLGGVESFTVDTAPPEPVDSLRLQRLPDGSVQLYWAPVSLDTSGRSELVAGFRIYRFDRLLKRYPAMTKYLVGESQDTRLVLRPADGKPPRIEFYLVQAVDEVGNESGRRRPAPLGSFATAFDPPNLDEIIRKQRARQ